MKFAIIGPTISGNKGAAGMFESTVQMLRARFPNPQFTLLSYYPKADRKLNTMPDVEIRSASPVNLATKVCLMSLVYGIMKKLKFPVLPFINKFKTVKAIEEADVVLDQAGVSFIDGRRIYLLFNIASLLPAIFLGKKIVKCAQALGPFDTWINKVPARLLLPRVSLIVARGEKTEENLESLGIEKKVLGVDLAFGLQVEEEAHKEAEKYLKDPVFKARGKIVGISPSSVIDNYCKKKGVKYDRIMADFINYLIEDKGYRVALIPHSLKKVMAKKEGGYNIPLLSLLKKSKGKKNDDAYICKAIYAKVKDKKSCFFLNEEIGPQPLRVLIGKCDLYVASRFHSMVSSLAMEVPTLVIGWSHKYAEVLKMFDMENFAFGHDKLNPDYLKERFLELESKQSKLRTLIKKNLPRVKDMAEDHVDHIEKVIFENPGKFKLGRLNNETQKYYLGDIELCGVGYSLDERIRDGAASGGLISTTLIHLLKTGKIDGALVTQSRMKKGRLDHRTFIATTRRQILSARTSVYYDVPVLAALDEVRKFEGKVAVVALPCQLKALANMCKKDKALDNKIAFKIGLFCGHISKKSLIRSVLAKKGINEEDIKEFKFRKGHWRGETHITLKDGKQFTFPYNHYGTYQNLFFDAADRCMACVDHTAELADISVGDVWDYAYKKLGIKHNAVILRNAKAVRTFDEMSQEGKIRFEEVPPSKIFKAQSRSLIFHKHVKARAVLGGLFGRRIPYDRKKESSRIHDYLAALMIHWTNLMARDKYLRKFVFAVPRKLWYIYLVVFKLLTSI